VEHKPIDVGHELTVGGGRANELSLRAKIGAKPETLLAKLRRQTVTLRLLSEPIAIGCDFDDAIIINISASTSWHFCEKQLCSLATTAVAFPTLAG